MPVKFYNAGGRICEKLAFDHPTNDPKVQNTISYYDLNVAEKAWFEVPTEVSLIMPDGSEQSVAVRFADRIQHDFKALGVVRVNPKPRGEISEDDNVALTDKDAKEKAEYLWEQAMYRLVREHQQTCAEIRNNGLRPQKARGNVAYALKTLGIEDPANDVEDVVKRKREDSEVDLLKQQLNTLQQTLNQLVGAKATK